MAIILYLGFLIGLIFNFKKLGQRDLKKNFMDKFVKKRIFNFFE